MSSEEPRQVVGTGPLGLAVARRLARDRRRVRALNRSGRAELPDTVEVVAADAADAASLGAALSGATVVYHCASTPYHTWPKRLPPIMTATIEAAATADARIVYGDNLYVRAAFLRSVAAAGPCDGRAQA